MSQTTHVGVVVPARCKCSQCDVYPAPTCSICKPVAPRISDDDVKRIAQRIHELSRRPDTK